MCNLPWPTWQQPWETGEHHALIRRWRELHKLTGTSLSIAFIQRLLHCWAKRQWFYLNVWESSGCRACSPFFEAAHLLGPKPESEQVAPALISSPTGSAGAAGSLPSAMWEILWDTVRSSCFLARGSTFPTRSSLWFRFHSTWTLLLGQQSRHQKQQHKTSQDSQQVSWN